MSDIKKKDDWGNISSSYFLKKSINSGIYKICRMVLLFGLCFLILQPILDKLSVSFMGTQDLYDGTVISIPRNFTLGNYRLANNLLYYWSSLLWTLLIITVSAVLQITACTLAGYGFARYKFPLKNFWFLCVMLIIIIPPHTIMSSLYLNFRFFNPLGLGKILNATGEFFGNLFRGNFVRYSEIFSEAESAVNMLSSVWGLWLLSATGMGLKSGLYIFMLRQYFRGMPKELEEAAWVDGCGKLYTFIRIMIPDAVPMITSCFLFSFVWQWTDSFYSTLFLSNYRVLARGLGGLSERYGQWYAASNVAGAAGGGVSSFAPVAQTNMILATGMLMTLAPLIILYLVAQKAFVESLSQTGIKM